MTARRHGYAAISLPAVSGIDEPSDVLRNGEVSVTGTTQMHAILTIKSRIRRMEGADHCPNGQNAAARMGDAKQTAARYRQNQSGTPFVLIVATDNG
jgi:hypothetical protein